MGPHRVNIINTLQLIASPTQQLEYQNNAPINIANEVVNQWFDDFYHPDFLAFEADFSCSELIELAKFNRLYDERVALLPDTLTEMLESEVWSEVMLEANRVLLVCGWKDLKVSYGK